MEYSKTITLKDGRTCTLRNGTEQDGEAARNNFILTHAQTDFLLSYPDEIGMTVEEEGQFLKEKAESSREIELLAEVDGKVAGMAGINCISEKAKTKHRAEFGISIDREFWGLGIGRALTRACIACAKEAGYEQVELDVAADNKTAITLYESEGFIEYGRNPKGFCSRLTGWQELVLMRLDLAEMKEDQK